MVLDFHIGLVSYGIYTPAEFERSEEIASRAGLTIQEVTELGIESKPRPGKEDQPGVMASKAAIQAFEKAPSVAPEDVDVVIWTGEEYKDYICQTSSIRLQEEVGCLNAFAFDLVGQGVTLIQGIRVARDLMIGDTSINTVLLAGGTRNVDLVDYANPHTRFLLPYSASGAAILLKRGWNANRIDSPTFVVDSKMADEVYVPGGGTEMPFSKEILGTPALFYQVNNPELLVHYLKNEWPTRLAEVTNKALNGRKIDFLALRHLPPFERDQVLTERELSSESSPDLYNWGHHGANDVVISLDLGLNSGAIKDGSVIALTSGGIGFTYASVVILWGLMH